MKFHLLALSLALLSYMAGYGTHALKGRHVEKHTGKITFLGCLDADKSICWVQHPNNTATILFLTSPGPGNGANFEDLVYVDTKRNDEWRQEVIKYVLPKEAK
jgi:hypothetical protein